MREKLITWADGILASLGLAQGEAGAWNQIIVFSLIIMLSVAVNAVCRWAIMPALQKVARMTKAKWDDELLGTTLLKRLFRLIPLFIIYVLLPLAFEEDSATHSWIRRIVAASMVMALTSYLNALVKVVFGLLEKRESMNGRPLKGVMQVLQIMLFLVALILVISIIIKEDPSKLLTGLGASAALMMLIFKDSITGLVSGVQLSANNMLKPGDWITMPKYGADGTVIDVTLNTVKVRNFDNTITTIPPYALTSDSFQNWRGMEESPGRRIKRSISIDMNSVKFCTPEMLDKYRRISLLTKYINDKEAELEQYNKSRKIDSEVTINARRQTNIGVFRAYLDRYLQSLDSVNHEMTCMVRQLQPTDTGIPIELYFFSAIKEWIPYERVQADVFDHVLSVIPEFDLHVFQNPSGRDFASLARDPGNTDK